LTSGVLSSNLENNDMARNARKVFLKEKEGLESIT
jgi:hypothetical protein